MSALTTYGWDVIYVTNYNIINKTIQEKHSYPYKFSEEIKFADNSYSIIGHWLSWSLKEGGSGKNIWLDCLVSSGNLFNENKEIICSLEDTRLTIQIDLAKFQNDSQKIVDPTSVNSGSAWILRVNDQNTKTSKPVIILDSEYKNILEEDQIIINQLFEIYFDKNIKDFEHIFSIIMLDLEAKNKDLQWIKPTAFSYAVGNAKNEKSHDLFGFLNLVDGKKTIGDLQQSLDIRANQYITDEVNALIIISKEMYTKYFLIPAAMNLIKGSNYDDFEISQQGLSIYNKKPLVWGDFIIGSEENHEIVSPLIPARGFFINLQEENININIQGATFRPKKGYVTSTININQSMNFETIRKGKNEFIFIPDLNNIQKTNINITNKVDKGVLIAEIIGGVIVMMSSVLVGVAAWRDVTILQGVSAATQTETELITFSSNLSEIDTRAYYQLVWDTADLMDNYQPVPVSLPLFNSLSVGQSIVSNFSLENVEVADLVKASLDKQYDTLSTFEKFTYNFTGTSTWPGTKVSEICSATLADCLVIGVKLDDV
ncbi:TULIP family P47-like protein [Xenorhabdus bovienii]|uniref:TULIP family P47-like protein n=1 Tax=Xenorhabdus bovienii TaxID=40576 RepID=UPI0023B27E25|nr:TULIP family P47-like protein [Xenorhabdus bovienii]MDE9553221.1 TULIP family P47-like protein [Xenorhabdus bovienii]